MSFYSISRSISSTIKLNLPPFLFSSRINFSTAEQLYTHLLNHPINPEKTLVKFAPKLDTQCVTEVLHRFSSVNPQLGLRFFIWAGVQPKYRHTRYMYSFTCKVFEIGRNPGRIREIIECYRVEGCQINVKLFKIVLNLCKQAGIADEGLWVLRKMGDFRCNPDSTMYNVVIGLFCERGDLDLAMELVREMELCNLCPDMITFMSLLKGFCNVGRLQDACGLFKTMKSNGCYPNMVAYSAVLDGLCRVGSFEKAVELLAEMEKEGGECKPNVITYTSVIHRLCKNGMLVEAFSVLDRMEGSKCNPNRVTVSVLVQGLCNVGDIDKAFKLVSDVVASGHVSSSDCYSCLVISLLKVKRFEEGQKLFRWMLENSVRPDGLACSVLVKDMCLKGEFVNAFCLYEDLERKGFVVTVESDVISDMFVGLCQQNCVAEVGKLASLMVEKGIQIKNDSYIDDIQRCLKGSIQMDSLARLLKMRNNAII